MRPRISIWGSVCPYVRPSVRPLTLRKNFRKPHNEPLKDASYCPPGLVFFFHPPTFLASYKHLKTKKRENSSNTVYIEQTKNQRTHRLIETLVAKEWSLIRNFLVKDITLTNETVARLQQRFWDCALRWWESSEVSRVENSNSELKLIATLSEISSPVWEKERKIILFSAKRKHCSEMMREWGLREMGYAAKRMLFTGSSCSYFSVFFTGNLKVTVKPKAIGDMRSLKRIQRSDSLRANTVFSLI